MRILHLCLSCFYNENYNYQENLLPRQHKKDGHEVLIVASTEVFVNNKTLDYVKPESYINNDGIKVIRVPYKRIICDAISRKFRAYKGVYSIMEDFKPDVMLFHGIGAWELRNVAKYAKKNNIKLYVDNHASLHNSANSWISLHLLHGFFYRSIVKKALPFVEKILNIAIEEEEFARDIYKIPEDKLELYPLGGYTHSDEQYHSVRMNVRNDLELKDDEIMFLHTGKLDSAKKSCELIKAFSQVKDEKFRLYIVGEFFEDIKEDAFRLIKQDNRITYLGWKNGSELMELLIGADVYLQPGTRSATMQNAMCCRCAMLVYPYKTYKAYLNENAFYVENENDIVQTFVNISKRKEQVKELKDITYDRAKEILDYRKLAARIY